MWERGNRRVGVLVQLAQEQEDRDELCSLASASVQVQQLCRLPERKLQLV